jgi:hypothetical protein
VPDVPPAPDEVAALRAANARMREVIDAKDTEVAVLRAQLEAYQAQLEELRAEVEALRARLRQNPRNSSKPPSSEGLPKPAPRSQRRKSGRKPGRPKGQPGATLEMTGRPDEVVRHEPGRCSGCGSGLFGAPVTGTVRRKVIDLPEEIRALVTEHQVISRRCWCGTVTTAAAPAGVSAPVQYGPRAPRRSGACATIGDPLAARASDRRRRAGLPVSHPVMAESVWRLPTRRPRR